MLTSTNRSREFSENVNNQIASNPDNWQIVFLTNQSLYSNSLEALYGPFFNLNSHTSVLMALIVCLSICAWAFACFTWNRDSSMYHTCNFFNAMQTSSSASSWRDFWKWVTLLPFCISSSACAVLERLSNIEHTSCCLMINMVNIVIQCYRSFFLLWYIPPPLFAL